jgi:membrane protease YdiL (CAAX protease family)
MTRRSVSGVATFFAVAFGLPWAGWLLVQNEHLSLWLFPLFASIAGFAATFVEGGYNGLKAFSCRVLMRVGAPRYLVAAAALPLALGLAFLLSRSQPLGTMPWSPLAILGVWLLAAVVTGPIAEEFGWRGYLQPKLLGYFAPFWAAIVVAVIWWLWHFALYRTSVFASPVSALIFLAYLTTWSIFMVFLVERAGGSAWPAVVLHWAANTHPGVLQALLPAVDGGALPGGSKGSLFYLSAACLFALVNRRFFFQKRVTDAIPDAMANNSSKPTPLRGAA